MMNSFSYFYLIFISLPLIQLQLIDPNSLNQSLTNLEFDQNLIKLPHVVILGALSQFEHMQILNNTNIYSNNLLSMSSQSFLLNSNPLLTMIELCELGHSSHAKVIIAGQPSNDTGHLTLTATAYVSDFYQIPMITIATRENIFSDNVNRIAVWMM